MKTTIRIPLRQAAGLGLAALLMAGAQSVQSQPAGSKKVTFPSGLHWQVMPLVTFDYTPKTLGTPVQRELAMSVWGDTIKAMPPMSKGKKYPSFILLSTFDTSATRYIFSSLDAASAAYERCDDPPNSSAAETRVYSMCPMRVVAENKVTGQREQQDFPNYCHLAVIDENLPLVKNHTAIAFDQRTKTAYFRVIQYGKHATECDRAIRLK